MIRNVSFLCSVVIGLQFASTALEAAQSAATTCPPFSFTNTVNLAQNPSFEVVGVNGNPSNCPAPCTTMTESAASRWTIHSSNQGAAVSTRLEALSTLGQRMEPYGTDPTPGRVMLHITAGGNEGGVYQILSAPQPKMMFQVWVYVRKGHVAVQPNGGNLGPGAWSTKLNQWEELRACTDGTVVADSLVIYNEDPAGGEFWVDRAEARTTP
jgi:hypothetical protein